MQDEDLFVCVFQIFILSGFMNYSESLVGGSKT